MLDIKFIRENKEAVKKNCGLRNIKCDIDRLLSLADERIIMVQNRDRFRARKNEINDEMIEADEKKRKELLKEAKLIKGELEKFDSRYKKVDREYNNLIWRVPNVSHPNSPIGKDDSENKEIEIYGEPPKFDFEPKGHEGLMTALDLIDFERGTKVTGTKFYFLKNEAALLEQALINYALDICLKENFIPFSAPDLAKDKILEGIGFNPRGEETQVYNIDKTDLSLVGTAEITMGGYHKDEIIEEESLPLKYVAFSHCFRTEAGSYGRHSAGLYRVHQFSKVEMFACTLPEKSEEMHTYFKDLEVKIFKGLGMPFRVVDICTGDLGGPAYRKYDLEAWMTGRNDWGEVTSTSNTTDYQARRLNIKVKRNDGKKEFLHMINGTAIAVSRALIAIVENGQLADGSIVVPEVLRKWMPGEQKIIKPKE